MIPPWIWQRFVLKEVPLRVNAGCKCRTPRHWLVFDNLTERVVSDTRLWTQIAAQRELERAHKYICEQLKRRSIEDILKDFETKFQQGSAVEPKNVPAEQSGKLRL